MKNFLIVVLFCLACGDSHMGVDSGTSSLDGGTTDAGVDANVDASLDAGTDASVGVFLDGGKCIQIPRWPCVVENPWVVLEEDGGTNYDAGR